MKPLYHPAMKDVTVEGLLYALSDPVRVGIFAGMQCAESAQTCSTYMKMGTRTLPKSTLSQHFKVLREAGLIKSERKGVELHNTTRCAELKTRFGPLVDQIIKAYDVQAGKGR